jgi:hypothetical protein
MGKARKPHPSHPTTTYWRKVRRLAKQQHKSIATIRSRLKRQAATERTRRATRALAAGRGVPSVRLPSKLAKRTIGRKVSGVRLIKIGPGQYIRADSKKRAAQAMLLIKTMRSLGYRLPDVVDIKDLRQTYDGRRGRK